MRKTILAFTLALVVSSAIADPLNGLYPAALTPATPCASVTGTFANINDSVAISCPGVSSFRATITLGSAPLVGTVAATDPANGQPRAFFKGGVGELDVSSIVLPTSNVAGQIIEYRFVGYDGLKLGLSALTSGTATVKIDASTNPAGTYLNNPVHTAEEAALRAGRAFVASTGNIAVPVGNYLNFVVTNPANSGKNVFITFRKYVQSSGNVLTYVNRTNPSAISGGTTVVMSNRRGDSTTAAVATFTYATSTTALTTGSASASGMIPGNGIDEAIVTTRMLAPGQSTGMSIGGQGGVLTAAANIAVDVAEYEEGVN